MPLLDTDQDLARDSYYAATAVRSPGHAPLAGTTSCDVAVVGGGLAGLSAALELRQRGFDVVLLEARELAWGGSGRNGGQAIHGLACDQATIEAQLGLDEAKRVWAMSIEALDLIRERIARHGIDCEWRDGYLGLATNARKGAELAEWADRMESVYGYALTRVGPAEVRNWIDSPRFHSGVHDPRSGHLHPLKYALGIARAAAEAGVRLHEHSPVVSMTPGEPAVLRTAGGEVHAQRVLLAGNVYLSGLAPALEPRIMPVGTYIACSSVLDDAVADRLIPSRSAVCDTNFVLDYFRTTDDNRMLYGGRVSYSTLTPSNLAESMRQRMVLSFPQLASTKVDYAWGGFVDISMNRAPDFGRLAGAPNVYYLQGFSGHGLALTGMAGRLVAEAIAGDASRFDVFARLRHRAFPGGRMLRTPALVLGMAWYRLRDILG
ncbi:NAD(P)/FAD-dependent oxidoreductase [Rubrivivax gelatinosus]|uniref:Gamma-glutamylputrescine oxidoreductase PuuB n=1 Tax=Rubrivivax gelatinosus (strain NBRC 100245 / IL144) TaxID=983917 RepID=I0HSH5_RUBGI|nr:FAD-binding oxidoreductase [Rubrivivax gelatinosus]BAL95962.1 gamma-glutamylputrescine oxidoreductase PuuB [Rubrivivax gelatinosus IL144]